MFKISISASVMIIAVLLIRLFRKRIPVQVFHFLWTLIAIRLLIPIELPSKLNFVYLLSSVQYRSINDREYPLVLSSKETTPPNMHHFGQTGAANRIFATENVIQLIWFTGFLLCSIYFISVYLRYQKKLLQDTSLAAFEKERLPQSPSRLQNFDVRISQADSPPLPWGY